MMKALKAAAGMAALAAVVFACSDSTDPDDDDVVYTANLTSGAELTTPLPQGNPTATGTATLTLDDDKNLKVVITVNGNLTSDVLMAHIHGPATASQSAGIILDFQPSMSGVINANARTGTIVNTTYDLPAAGAVLKISADSLITLLNNGNAYVNVHTDLNTGGELRGQIVKQ
jgi:hypothetical protein